MNTTPLLLLFESLNSAVCPLFTDEESKRNDEVFIVLEFFAGDPLWSHFPIFFLLASCSAGVSAPLRRACTTVSS
jgi:hypothetical protein